MSSAIGDILLNPRIEGSTANEKMKAEERSMMANALKGNRKIGALKRFISSGLKSAAFLPDAILNKVSDNPLDILQESLTGTKVNPLKTKDPLEKALRALNLVKELPKAETTAQKYAESFGDALGGLAVPFGLATRGGMLGRALLGSKAPLKSAKQLVNSQFASTLGGAATIAGLQPTIDDAFPDSPAARLALSLGAGIGGGALAGGATSGLLKAFGKPSQALPKATAAQMGDIADPRTRELTARQLDLTKTDPKAANILNEIAINQEEAILNKLNSETSLSGKDIINNVKESVQNLKDLRKQDYDNAFSELINNAPNAPINVGKTLNLISDLQNKAAKGGKAQGILENAKRMIADNVDEPHRLIEVKKELQDLVQYRGELSLGSSQSAKIKQIIKELNSDIGTALPGYAEMNAQYAKQSENLEALLEGVAGKAGKFEANRPSEIVKQLFEKTDPELVDQLRQVLSPEVYDQAANLYLSDVAAKGIGKYTPLEENNIQKFQQMAKTLEENSDVLMKTLPEKQRGIVQEVIQDIAQTGRGRPRNEFTVNANRNVVVGDEVKGIGKAPSKIAEIAGYSGGGALGAGIGTLVGGPIGTGIGAGIGLGATALGKKISSSASKSLRLNEMLTGQSPSSQVAQGFGNAGIRAGQKFAAANSLSQDNAQPIPPQPQVPMQIYNQSSSFEDKGTPSSLDSLIEEFSGQSNAAHPSQPMNQSQGSSLDALIQEFESAPLSKNNSKLNKNMPSARGNYNMGTRG